MFYLHTKFGPATSNYLPVIAIKLKAKQDGQAVATSPCSMIPPSHRLPTIRQYIYPSYVTIFISDT